MAGSSWTAATSTSPRAGVIGMAEALALDPTLREIADLPPGWLAQRARRGGPLDP